MSEFGGDRHCWMPVPAPGAAGRVRHAYPGRRWQGEPHALAACGLRTPMAVPSQMDWITAPAYPACHHALLGQ